MLGDASFSKETGGSTYSVLQTVKQPEEEEYFSLVFELYLLGFSVSVSIFRMSLLGYYAEISTFVFSKVIFNIILYFTSQEALAHSGRHCIDHCHVTIGPHAQRQALWLIRARLCICALALRSKQALRSALVHWHPTFCTPCTVANVCALGDSQCLHGDSPQNARVIVTRCTGMW